MPVAARAIAAAPVQNGAAAAGLCSRFRRPRRLSRRSGRRTSRTSTLLHAGPPVTAIPQIGEQATKDLGLHVNMQATENADLLNRFLSQSSAIDVGDVSITFMKYLVGRDILQAIPLAKYKYWDQTIPLFTKGEYPDGRKASSRASRPIACSTPPGRTARNSPTGRANG